MTLWVCIGEQHSLQPSAAVQWNENNQDGENYENKAAGEKNKNYPSYRKKIKRCSFLCIPLDLLFLRVVTHIYTTSVFAQTYLLWCFSLQAFPLQYSALLFNGILFHDITAFQSQASICAFCICLNAHDHAFYVG